MLAEAPSAIPGEGLLQFGVKLEATSETLGLYAKSSKSSRVTSKPLNLIAYSVERSSPIAALERNQHSRHERLIRVLEETKDDIEKKRHTSC